MGEGKGTGEADTATRVAAGSGVAVCFTVCFFCIGIPCIFAGIAMVAIFKSGSIFAVGVVLLVLSFLFLIVAIILVVAICTNCFGKGSRTDVQKTNIQNGTQSHHHNTQLQDYDAEQPPPRY